MANVVAMIQERQKGSALSPEKYANQIGLTSGTLYKYFSGERKAISVVALRVMGKYYAKQGDTEMLSALASYALDVNGKFVAT